MKEEEFDSDSEGKDKIVDLDMTKLFCTIDAMTRRGVKRSSDHWDLLVPRDLEEYTTCYIERKEYAITKHTYDSALLRCMREKWKEI